MCVCSKNFSQNEILRFKTACCDAIIIASALFSAKSINGQFQGTNFKLKQTSYNSRVISSTAT